MKKLLAIYLLLLPFYIDAQPIEEIKKSLFVGVNQPKVMILGVYHFHNPGLDTFKPKDLDMLTEKKQQEIDELLDKIEKFNPTKILIEYSRGKMDSIIDEQYNRYLQGFFDISKEPNEIYQIAFKLAKKLNHPRVYCSDSYVGWCGTDDIDWDNFGDEEEKEYLLSKNQYNKSVRYDYNTFYEYMDSLKMVLPLTQYLLFANNPSVTKKVHQFYLTNLVLNGAGDNYYGADSVNRWYHRNLRIFSNLYDLITFDREDRVLLLYGSGHVWLLRQFIQDSPDFKYIEVNDYLEH